ncbi:MAG: ribulose phosphate epimerase [Atopobiaceae bacterium]|nr:ribulose phosphate epimerase [Atopobiaceae bacterium]
MHVQMAPSLMNMSLLNVRNDIGILDKYADCYHVDIIDGHYIRNMCLTPHVMREIRSISSTPMEAHLYMEGIDISFIDDCIDCGATAVTLPSDTVGRSVHRFCNHIRKRGAEAGIFINPYQPIDVISPYADLIDRLIILAVDPGFTGQDFIESTYERIRRAKQIREESGSSFLISVDGGCNSSNYKALIGAGCDALILGRGLFESTSELEESARTTRSLIDSLAQKN